MKWVKRSKHNSLKEWGQFLVYHVLKLLECFIVIFSLGLLAPNFAAIYLFSRD